MSEQGRLHPASPVFNIVRHARTLLVPGLAVLFVGGDAWQLWIMVLFVPSAVFEIARFFTFRYTLADDRIVTTMVFVSRTERSVRYERIQNIESVQSVFHRVLGVAEIRVETGAGGKPEVVLRVVPAAEAERIRERVFADRETTDAATESGGAGAAGDPSDGTRDADVPRRELLGLHGLDFLRLGLITMRGLVFVAIAFGLAWEYQLFDQLDAVQAWLLDRASGTTQVGVGLTVGAFVLFAAAALVGGSVLWAVLRFGGFRLSRRGDDFRIESGLLTRIGATVPRGRIQLVRLTETFQHRRFERVAIGVETAGGVDPESGKESSFGRQWFAPLVRHERVPIIAREIRDSLSFDTEHWQRLSVRAKRRLLRRSVLIVGPVTLGIGTALFLMAGWWAALLALAGGVAAVCYDRWAARLVRYRRAEEWIGCRSGALTRQTSVAFLDRVQVVDVVETPFDRRAGMATLRIDTAGATPMAAKADLPMLDAAEARGHAAAVVGAAERKGFIW